MQTSGFVLAFLIFCCTGACADSYEKGVEEFAAGNYGAAFQIWELAARGGNLYAMVNVGSMYLNGRGVARNLREASTWFRSAAIRGNVHAQHLLADMYFKGLGVSQDLLAARVWFGIALAQGDDSSKAACIEIDKGLTDSEKAQVNQSVEQCKTFGFVGCHY